MYYAKLLFLFFIEQEMLTKIVNLDEIQLPEAKYLLEKLLSMSVNQSCLAVQKDGAIREMENRMNQAAKQNTLHQQLLQHMIEQQVNTSHLKALILYFLA